MVAIVIGEKYGGWQLPPVLKDRVTVWRNVGGMNRLWRQTAQYGP